MPCLYDKITGFPRQSHPFGPETSRDVSAPYKNPSQNNFQEGFDVLRTGIEPHVIISKLNNLQAVLQAVKEDFCKFCNYCSSGFSKGSSSGD